MNVMILGGFLGSGKTSILLEMASYINVQDTKGRTLSDKISLVIVENEIGETGIDDKILKAQGLKVRELFSGCICCTLNTELTVVLEEIGDKYAPEWVIIEATGMAYPHKIVDTLVTYGKGIASLKTIVVVDAERWEELSTVIPGLVEGQIVKADIILLNKIDCLEPVQIADIEDSVRKLNRAARFYSVSAAKGIDPDILRQVIRNE